MLVLSAIHTEMVFCATGTLMDHLQNIAMHVLILAGTQVERVTLTIEMLAGSRRPSDDTNAYA